MKTHLIRRIMVSALVTLIFLTGGSKGLWVLNAAEEENIPTRQISNCDTLKGWSGVRVQNWGVDKADKKEGKLGD